MYFEYGDTEIEYLKRKDKKLGEAIDHIGHIYREVDADIFQSVVHHIIGQQISNDGFGYRVGAIQEFGGRSDGGHGLKISGGGTKKVWECRLERPSISKILPKKSAWENWIWRSCTGWMTRR